jgi:hypothetical protein
MLGRHVFLLEELHSFAATAIVHVRQEQITVVAALQISKCRAISIVVNMLWPAIIQRQEIGIVIITLTLSGDGFKDGTSAYTGGIGGGGGTGPGTDVAGIPFSSATLYSSKIKCICILINK